MLDAHVLVGLVVHGVEDHRHDTGAVHVDRDGRQVSSKLEVSEEVHEPLGLLGSSKQRGILGVVGARGHEGVQLGEPRQHGIVEAEDIGDSAVSGVAPSMPRCLLLPRKPSGSCTSSETSSLLET